MRHYSFRAPSRFLPSMLGNVVVLLNRPPDVPHQSVYKVIKLYQHVEPVAAMNVLCIIGNLYVMQMTWATEIKQNVIPHVVQSMHAVESDSGRKGSALKSSIFILVSVLMLAEIH